MVVGGAAVVVGGGGSGGLRERELQRLERERGRVWVARRVGFA